MILLDTHVLLWQERGDRRLGNQTRDLVHRALEKRAVAVSAITFWEVAMRIQKGQLELDFDLYDWRDDLLEHGLVEIPINGVIAARAGRPADIHGDPADRLIVATALAGHRLVTSDERILAWGGNLDRMDARE